jgi:hypothetical protein
MKKIISLWHQYQISNGAGFCSTRIDKNRKPELAVLEQSKQSDMMDDFCSFMRQPLHKGIQ